MLTQKKIIGAVNNSFDVTKLILENESHMHGGDALESHFKMILITDDFVNLSKVKRHQAVYKVLKDIMPTFHALALHVFTNKEWQDFNGNLTSPNCEGGGKG